MERGVPKVDKHNGASEAWFTYQRERLQLVRFLEHGSFGLAGDLFEHDGQGRAVRGTGFYSFMVT